MSKSNPLLTQQQLMARIKDVDKLIADLDMDLPVKLEERQQFIDMPAEIFSTVRSVLMRLAEERDSEKSMADEYRYRDH